jgi:hypothetical protein
MVIARMLIRGGLLTLALTAAMAQLKRRPRTGPPTGFPRIVPLTADG